MTQYIGIAQEIHGAQGATVAGVIYNEEFYVAILDDEKQSIAAQSFYIERGLLPEDATQGADAADTSYPEDLKQIADFILSKVADPISVQVACEVCSVYFPQDAPLYKLLVLLNKLGCCTCSFASPENVRGRGPVPVRAISILPPPIRKEIERQVLSMMAPEALEQVRKRQGRVLGPDPMFLGTGVGRAYADFLLGRPATLLQAAVAVALVATRPAVHSYLFSSGEVQCSNDIITALRQYQQFNRAANAGTTSVVSGEAVFTQHCTGETRTEDLEKIPLTHAVVLQKYQHLGPRESLKIALLEVAKEWKFELYCYTDQTKLPDKKQVFWSRWFGPKQATHHQTHPSYLVSSPAGVFEPWALSLLETVEDLLS